MAALLVRANTLLNPLAGSQPAQRIQDLSIIHQMSPPARVHGFRAALPNKTTRQARFKFNKLPPLCNPFSSGFVVMGGPGEVGRALRLVRRSLGEGTCPPSDIGIGINVQLLWCGESRCIGTRPTSFLTDALRMGAFFIWTLWAGLI